MTKKIEYQGDGHGGIKMSATYPSSYANEL